MREADSNTSWRLDNFKVQDFDKAVALKATKHMVSLNHYFMHTKDVKSATPLQGDSHSVADLFMKQEKKYINDQEYFKFRELWLFPRLDELEVKKFSEANAKHKGWMEEHEQTHFKVGYPNRFLEDIDKNRQDEETRERRSLTSRQLHYSHPDLSSSMTQFYNHIASLIKQDADDETERAKQRLEQISHENEIRNRPKPDPYNESKDANIQAIKLILLNGQDWKRQRYEQQLIRSICNKFVNKYFDSLGGINFCRENPSVNFVKPRVDKELLRELQDLGKQTLEEEKEREAQNRLQFTREIDQKTAKDFHYSSGKLADNPYSSAVKRPFRIKNGGCSVFKQMEKDRIMQEDLARQKNLENLSKMRKEYDIYGKQRRPLEPIFGMFKGSPEYEYNDKTINVEAPTDKRVKISSTAQRAYLHAPSIDEVRNTGTHETLMKTLDKGNTVKEVEMRGKLMPTSKLEVKEKDFIIYPHQIDFGVVKPGNCYKAEIVLINENYFLQRVKVIAPIDSNVRTTLSHTGPIAMGQERRITVYLDTEKLEEGEVETEVHIMSKYRKYTIPIKAKLGPNVEDAHHTISYKGKREQSGQLKRIITIETKGPYNLTGKPSDEASPKRLLPVGFNEVHKKYLSLFNVQEVNRQEMEQIKTKQSGSKPLK
jgi:hypothetical protein